MGDTVRYNGTRIEAKKDGTITEIKKTGSPWISVLGEDLGLKSVRQGEITKEVVEQPPALSHEEEEAVEEHLEAQAEASEGSIIKIDEEAAEYKIDKGSFKDYRNIHAIYTDTKKADANRKYLRFRASKVIGGDETTKEMCHRYLVSVQARSLHEGGGCLNREQMIDALVKRDIDTLAYFMEEGDHYFLDTILRDEGWIAYNQRTDEQLKNAYTKMIEKTRRNPNEGSADT